MGEGVEDTENGDDRDARDGVEEDMQGDNEKVRDEDLKNFVHVTIGVGGDVDMEQLDGSGVVSVS